MFYGGYQNDFKQTPNTRLIGNYFYENESQVDDNTINVDVVKEYLGIPSTVDDRDALIGSLIITARVVFERASGVTVLLTNYKTYRDDFCNNFFVLGKRPFKSIESITYLNEDKVVKTVDPSVYYTEKKYPFEIVRLSPEKDVFTSENLYEVKNNVKINFKAGFSDENGIYPEDIKTAILAIIANIYANRGDCQSSSNIGSIALPDVANSIISKYICRKLAHAEYLEDKLDLSEW